MGRDRDAGARAAARGRARRDGRGGGLFECGRARAVRRRRGRDRLNGDGDGGYSRATALREEVGHLCEPEVCRMEREECRSKSEGDCTVSEASSGVPTDRQNRRGSEVDNQNSFPRRRGGEVSRKGACVRLSGRPSERPCPRASSPHPHPIPAPRSSWPSSAQRVSTFGSLSPLLAV